MTTLTKFDASEHIETASDVRDYLTAASEGSDAKHIASAVADVMRSPWAAPTSNTSGVRPLDNRVLVKPDAVEKKTSGGIILPDEHTDKQQMAQIRATLIAAGINAWAEAKATSSAFHAPAPGARVLIAKYGGIVVDGEDGEKYRIMNDTDITAELEA